MQRKSFTPTEAEAIASAIEAALRPVAQERKAEAFKARQGQSGRVQPIGEDSAPMEKEPKSREVAAQAVGYGRDTISKVRKVKVLAEYVEAEAQPKPIR